MDFIDRFPPSQGHIVIMVIVEKFSKNAHFLSLAHQYTATSIALLFVDNIFELHGMPKTIVSDRDPIFISTF